MTGGGGGGEYQEGELQAVDQQGAPQQYQSHEATGPACQFELKQFIECAQMQSDISLCQGFNEALRDCRTQYGTYHVVPAVF